MGVIARSGNRSVDRMASIDMIPTIDMAASALPCKDQMTDNVLGSRFVALCVVYCVFMGSDVRIWQAQFEPAMSKWVEGRSPRLTFAVVETRYGPELKGPVPQAPRPPLRDR